VRPRRLAVFFNRFRRARVESCQDRTNHSASHRSQGTGALAHRPVRRLALLAAGLGVSASLMAFVLPTAAQAASPWFQLGSGSRPTYINPNAGHPGASQVQEILVTGAEIEGHPGQAFVRLGVGSETFLFATEPLDAEFELEQPELNVANIQAALEGPYGSGQVTVVSLSAPPGGYAFEVTGPSGPSIEASIFAFGTSAEAKVINPGGEAVPDGEVYATVTNLGDATASGAGTPLLITDVLPHGLVPVNIVASKPELDVLNIGGSEALPCDPTTLTCELKGSGNGGKLPPFDQVELRISVNVEPGTPEGILAQPNLVKVSGGGLAPAQAGHPLIVSSTPTPFGVDEYQLRNEEEGGAPATRAASHPFQSTTTVTLNQAADQTPLENSSHRPQVFPAALAKDTSFHWPPGLFGNPSPFPRCTATQFATLNPQPFEYVNACPQDTAVGVAAVTVTGDPIHTGTFTVPLFNLEPEFGQPARLGFIVVQANATAFIEPALRSGDGEDYGLNIDTSNISQQAALTSVTVTVWGTPGDPRHANSRGWGCLGATRNFERVPACEAATEEHPAAFFSLPTNCTSPLASTLHADSWIDSFPLESLPQVASYESPALGACNQVPFAPTMHAEPTSNAATSPTGLSFDLGFQDEGLTNGEGLIQSQLKKAVVTLPQGFTTNPSVAEGLKACSPAQFHAETLESQAGEGCPNESKIGDVELESPLIEGAKVTGSLYVATQNDNPSTDPQHPNGNLLTIYLVVRNRERGVIVKQALKVTPNPITGQLQTEVDSVPQLPFSRFNLSFRQGQRSPLITPPTCGTYTIGADLYPWARPSEPVHRESSFKIETGPEGQGCPSGVPPFHPGLEAGTINNSAGTYSPFYTHITRKDSEQEITRFSIKLPPGVIGKLAGVSECSDSQIAAAKAREREGGGEEELQHPSCPANSEVGHSLVGSGVGNVLAYAPGKLYLAGPYHGSNISLVSITAAKVGPFDLGTVVVRFALRIDPETAEVFVDSQGSDPIPHIVDGIPIHLRDIRAYVDRPNFTLNPTSCAKKSTASTVLGSGLNFASEADDQPVTVTSPFQAADCANLGFKPKLALSLKGGTRRAATPAFKAVVTYPKGGAYANIARAVVALPHSEFLEQAHIKTVCTRVQFKEGGGNGEKCPKASIYGKAEAVTPLLSEPLKGPVYLRSSSHNLPDLVAALHNRQVDFDLDGRIDSFKGGIRNTFETVPDAPVSKFVLEMQGGKKGLLTNSTNLCKSKHRATSELTAQNGKIYNTNPVVSVKCGGKGKKKSGKKSKGGKNKPAGSNQGAGK
jgi:hypothetical protein